MTAQDTGTTTYLCAGPMGEACESAWDELSGALRAACVAHGGRELDVGAELCFAFARASDAVAAALAGQRAADAHAPMDCVAMGVNAGEPEADAVRGTRLVQLAAHGGQVLLSEAARIVAGGHLPAEASLSDLGPRRLADLAHGRRLFQLRHPALGAEFPPPRTLDVLPNNLPAQLTLFIGRTGEVADIRKLALMARVVTLTGAGGSGKTRLALHAAAELAAEVPGGVWFVELAPIADPALVGDAVAAALGVAEEPGRDVLDAVIDAVGGTRVLVVLDNCEHVIDVCAKLVDSLVRACPELAVIATSREPLDITGETVSRVPTLAVPSPGEPFDAVASSEAVRLFCERASAVLPAFRLSETNAPAVREICARLDGIPLAIELAAARVSVLGVEQIRERLHDRFRLLTTGSRTALPRQQTLRALVDWSYDLLSPFEQTALARLSVFAGGFELEAAEAVCAGDDLHGYQVLDLVAELVDKSLLHTEDLNGRVRYGLLETIREYAASKLVEAGDEADARRRHRDWCLAVLEREAVELSGEHQAAALDRLEREHDNLRAALDWTIRHDPLDAANFAGHMWKFWYRRRHLREGRSWMERVLAVTPPGDTPDRAGAMHISGLLACEQGHYEAAWAMVAESVAMLRRMGHDETLSIAVGDLGVVALRSGDLRRARDGFEESLAIARRLGDRLAIANALHNLGGVDHALADAAAATAAWEEALAIWRELGKDTGIAATLCNLGGMDVARGAVDAGAERLEEGMRIAARLGDRSFLPYYLDAFAQLAAARDDPRRAARVYGAAEGLREAVGAPLPAVDVAARTERLDALRTRLGPQDLSSELRAGRSLTADEAIAHALGGPTTEEAPPAVEVPVHAATFRREGEFWTVAYGGRSARFRDAKGMRYLAELLESPGREVHVADLIGTHGGGAAAERAAADAARGDLSVGGLGDAGELLDPQAREAYRKRLEDLREDLEEAERWGDPERAARAQAEIDVLARELGAAFGLGGRARKGADTAERSRKAVTNRIRDAVQRIGKEHPELGRHLANAVRTGTFCAYEPERPVRWEVRS